MQGTVEKYRYVRTRILRLLAYDNRDSHVGIYLRRTVPRWLSKP